MINELRRRGKLRPDILEKIQAKKNAVTRAVGVFETVEVDTSSFLVAPGDRFVLCSDGLHRYLADEAGLGPMVLGTTDDAATRRMIDWANERGGEDNITAVCVTLPDEERREAVVEELRHSYQTLSALPFFRNLEHRELLQVQAIARVRDEADGVEVITEGAPGDAMFVLMNGRCTVRKGDLAIARIEPGEHFGEMAMVERAPRSATVVVEGGARLLEIARADLFRLLRESHETGMKLLWNIVAVLAQRLRETSSQLGEAREALRAPDLTDELFLEDHASVLPTALTVSASPPAVESRDPGSLNRPTEAVGGVDAADDIEILASSVEGERDTLPSPRLGCCHHAAHSARACAPHRGRVTAVRRLTMALRRIPRGAYGSLFTIGVVMAWGGCQDRRRLSLEPDARGPSVEVSTVRVPATDAGTADGSVATATEPWLRVTHTRGAVTLDSTLRLHTGTVGGYAVRPGGGAPARAPVAQRTGLYPGDVVTTGPDATLSLDPLAGVVAVSPVAITLGADSVLEIPGYGGALAVLTRGVAEVHGGVTPVRVDTPAGRVIVSGGVATVGVAGDGSVAVRSASGVVTVWPSPPAPQGRDTRLSAAEIARRRRATPHHPVLLDVDLPDLAAPTVRPVRAQSMAMGEVLAWNPLGEPVGDDPRRGLSSRASRAAVLHWLALQDAAVQQPGAHLYAIAKLGRAGGGDLADARVAITRLQSAHGSLPPREQADLLAALSLALGRATARAHRGGSWQRVGAT